MENKNTIAYIKAEKRVKEVKSFYKFLFIGVSLSCFFMLVNFFTNRHEFWSIYPTLILALVVAFKYARVFGWPGFGKEWEERQFYEELERIQEREERIRTMLNKEKKSIQIIQDKQNDTSDLDKLDLKELRRQYRDTDLV